MPHAITMFVVMDAMDDIEFIDIKTGKKYICDWVFVMFPNGKTGYRLEYVDEDEPFTQDLGTLYVEDGKLKIVQW